MSLSRISGIATSSGVVYDAITKQYVPDVTLELITNTGPTGTYYTTDSNGAFVAPTFGVYGIRFTHAEYAPVDIPPASVQQGMVISMNPKATVLPEIIIKPGAKNTWLWLAALAIGYYGYKQKWFA